MRIWLCGVRGSVPAIGPDFQRVGGATSCVAIGDAQPRLVLDGGTGLDRVSALLDPRPFRGPILLSLLHPGHTGGLSRFAAADRPGAEVDLRRPARRPDSGNRPPAAAEAHGERDALEGLGRAWSVTGLGPGDHEIGGYQVRARELPHRDEPTLGFRVTDGSGSMAYLPAHGPTALGRGPSGSGVYHHDAVELAYGVDVLLHGAMFGPDEQTAADRAGHATTAYAAGLAGRCRVGRLVLVHHHPERSADPIGALAADTAACCAVPVTVGREGDRIDLPFANGGAGAAM